MIAQAVAQDTAVVPGSIESLAEKYMAERGGPRSPLLNLRNDIEIGD